MATQANLRLLHATDSMFMLAEDPPAQLHIANEEVKDTIRAAHDAVQWPERKLS